ncbi:MAG: DUF1565 domain-containing protein [bacterium]|nr:DUF1565 domain-containing protein [bacterium]
MPYTQNHRRRKRHVHLLSFLAGTLLWAVASPAPADVYYVALNGLNSNPGSESKPWRTIQKAANTMTAGDTVYIKAGTYSERVVPQASGSAGNLITYAAYPGHAVTIDGTGVSIPAAWGGLFEISERSYIKVSGLRIRDAGPDDNHVGILVEDSSYVTIEDNVTYNTASSGIGVWSSDHVVVAGNEVELACNDGEQECLTVAGTDVFEVRDNWVHDGGPGSIGGEGIDVKDGSSNGVVYGNRVESLTRLGIYIDAWDKHTYNIDVYQNTVSDCAADGFAVASEAGGLLENVRIFNNVAYHNKWLGLTVAGWGAPVPSHPIQDLTVINNTFHANGWSEWGGGISVENPDAVGVVLRNNIVSQNLSFQIQVDSGVPMPTTDNNLIDGFRGVPGEIRGSEYEEGDPGFENPSTPDHHLTEGSPAIDTGSAVAAPADDFDGTPRPQGSGVDMGAFEFASALIFSDGFESGDVLRWSCSSAP